MNIAGRAVIGDEGCIHVQHHIVAIKLRSGRAHRYGRSTDRPELSRAAGREWCNIGGQKLQPQYGRPDIPLESGHVVGVHN